ncbi:DUF305 domain-containing protein [Deinococcus yunweiensis]|uniref:DUF305 domain-containing protein n=1 Tax=Deinococcus yunweiensis TaxID=367282 RepID=UPI00398E9462
MKQTALLLVGSAALVSGIALAQGAMGGMDHSKMGMTPAATPMEQGMMPMGGGMSMDMSGLQKLSGKAFDRAFLSMMIPHHQTAIDMARAVLPVGKDATVKKWANMVIQDQAKEINEMTKLLPAFGGNDAAMATMMKSSMAGMANAVKTSKTPDQAFVQGMLPHHSSALDMAQLALEKSSDARVLKLARDIVTAQAREMYDFRLWLTKRSA